MIAVLMLKGYKSEIKPEHKYIKLYVVYLFLMTFALIANGEISEFNYINYILGSHVVCIVAFYATYKYIVDYKSFKMILIPLGVTTVCTSIATILQYYNNPLGWAIATTFNSGNVSEWQAYIIDRHANEDTMLGHSYQVGIFGFGFTNAAFLCSIGLLYLFFAIKETKRIVKLICYAVFTLSIVACFMTQQRAAFIVMFILALYCLYNTIQKKWLKTIIILSACIAIPLTLPLLSENESLGRMTEFSGARNDSRYNIWVRAVDFLSSNILVGGPQAASRYIGTEAHNIILNAFIWGGLFGGIVILTMIWKMLCHSISVLWKGRRNLVLSSVFALGFCSYTTTSLFHNVSIISGSELSFLLIAWMSIAVYLENINYSK